MANITRTPFFIKKRPRVPHVIRAVPLVKPSFRKKIASVILGGAIGFLAANSLVTGARNYFFNRAKEIQHSTYVGTIGYVPGPHGTWQIDDKAYTRTRKHALQEMREGGQKVDLKALDDVVELHRTAEKIAKVQASKPYNLIFLPASSLAGGILLGLLLAKLRKKKLKPTQRIRRLRVGIARKMHGSKRSPKWIISLVRPQKRAPYNLKVPKFP